MSDADRTKLALLMLNCFLASTLGKQVGCTRVAPDVPQELQEQGTILYETRYSWYIACCYGMPSMRCATDEGSYSRGAHVGIDTCTHTSKEPWHSHLSALFTLRARCAAPRP